MRSYSCAAAAMTRRDRLAVLTIAVGLALAGVSALFSLYHNATDAARVGGQPAYGERTLSSPASPDGHADTARPRAQLPHALPSPPVRPGRPIEIRIPALGVATAVTPISSDVSGVLVPPADYTTVGWWAAGVRPGAKHGTVLVTGHTVHTGGGAFDNLDRMRAGQRVVVERPHRDLVYRVSTVTVYRKGTLANRAATIFAQTGEARLALVTCEDWDGSEYLSNVVVLATSPRVVHAD